MKITATTRTPQIQEDLGWEVWSPGFGRPGVLINSTLSIRGFTIVEPECERASSPQPSPPEEEREKTPRICGRTESVGDHDLPSCSGPAKAGSPCLLLMLLAASTCLTGCFGFLKPVESTTRHFVLTPLPLEKEARVPGALGVGLSQVRVPPYLFDTSLAVRKGTNEITYLTSVLWAERLDNGLQRVLAANLSTLLSSDQVRLSAWRSDEVSAEVHVSIQQFDVDTRGQGVLVAWWRILSPGGEKTLKTGETHLTRAGPSPETGPGGAVATLSELVADFSRQLAEAVKEVSGGK